ncbi:hypothetical protein [Heliomicrobium modesticaldum]|nr:hypothetical protein [Heliomicrobium modesticaldum]
MPTPDEAEQLGGLLHDDNFGSKACRRLWDAAADELMQRDGVERFLELSSYGWRYGNVYWPQLIVTRRYPLYFFQQHLKRRRRGSYVVAFHALVARIVADGVRELMIYGAGEAGRVLFQLAAMQGLRVLFFIDKKQHLWGKSLEGVQVVSLEEAASKGNAVFAVGSIAYLDEIRGEIERRYAPLGRPRIYTAY